MEKFESRRSMRDIGKEIDLMVSRDGMIRFVKPGMVIGCVATVFGSIAGCREIFQKAPSPDIFRLETAVAMGGMLVGIGAGLVGVIREGQIEDEIRNRNS